MVYTRMVSLAAFRYVQDNILILTLEEDKLKGIIEEIGAQFSGKVIPQCTHLVTTVREVENTGSKGMLHLILPDCLN